MMGNNKPMEPSTLRIGILFSESEFCVIKVWEEKSETL